MAPVDRATAEDRWDGHRAECLTGAGPDPPGCAIQDSPSSVDGRSMEK